MPNPLVPPAFEKVDPIDAYTEITTYVSKEVIDEYLKIVQKYKHSRLNRLKYNISAKAKHYKIHPSSQQIPFSKVSEHGSVDDPDDVSKAVISFVRKYESQPWDEQHHPLSKELESIYTFSIDKTNLYKFVEKSIGGVTDLYDYVGEKVKDKVKKASDKLDELNAQIETIIEDKRRVTAAAFFSVHLGLSMSLFNSPLYRNNQNQKPGIIIGSVPFYTIHSIERAKSDRKLKHRAIGDVFLAHQKGNKDLLRVDATLRGPLRFLQLAFLSALQTSHRAKIENLTLSQSGLNIASASPNVENLEKTDKAILNYETHDTVPIITENMILTNMYLQTVESHQSIEDGVDVIKVHMLFRKYFPTSAYKVFQPITKEIEGEEFIVGGSSIEVIEEYGTAKRWLEWAIDFIWRMKNLGGEIYPRMLIGADGLSVGEIDRQAASDTSKLLTSYSGKLLGII